MRSPGSFDLPDHPGRLPRTDSPPEAPGRHVDPGAFRPVLTEAPGHGDRPEGGRPPRDPVTMSGIPVPASMDGPGNGRMGFPGFWIGGPAPDRRTGRPFRERLARAGAFTSLSAASGERLRDRGRGGRTVDAASVPAPRRRMAGKGRERAGAARKDTDARRTAGYSGARKTGGGKPDTGPVGIPAPRFGYGNHIGIDRGRRCSRIHSGKPRGRPMPGQVRRGDATRPSIRARIGHVSGYGKGPMAVTVRRIGLVRAAARMAMANPGHGFRRPVLHERRQAGA